MCVAGHGCLAWCRKRAAAPPWLAEASKPTLLPSPSLPAAGAQVNDFGWLRATPSPHWAVLPEAERAAAPAAAAHAAAPGAAAEGAAA